MEIRAAYSYDPAARESARDYILAMVSDLAAMARRADEQVLAIHLKAIVDAARAARRDRTT